MRTVSADDLARMKRKGGVRVKRRLGTKKPEPEVEDTPALSGAKESEALPPAPVPPPAPDMQPMASMEASMAARDAQLKMIIANSNKIIEEFKLTVKEISKPRKRVPWDAIIYRAKNGLMNRIRLEPDES